MGLQIIYLDDSETALASVKQALESVDHLVSTTTTAAAIGEEILSTDLVLIDFHLPERDGSVVLADIQRRWGLRAAPPYFYLYTGDREAGARYRTMGFHGHFILKGNLKALVCQVAGAERSIRLRNQRPRIRSKTASRQGLVLAVDA